MEIVISEVVFQRSIDHIHSKYNVVSSGMEWLEIYQCEYSCRVEMDYSGVGQRLIFEKESAAVIFLLQNE